IRVYDLGGKVLFDAWHDGIVRDAAWLSAPRLLILSGVNSEVLWDGRLYDGHPVTGRKRSMFPAVVTAIEPRLGARAGWIATPTAPHEFQPRWYRCALPPEAPD